MLFRFHHRVKRRRRLQSFSASVAAARRLAYKTVAGITVLAFFGFSAVSGGGTCRKTEIRPVLRDRTACRGRWHG
jgi:hypothetical protein